MSVAATAALHNRVACPKPWSVAARHNQKKKQHDRAVASARRQGLASRRARAQWRVVFGGGAGTRVCSGTV